MFRPPKPVSMTLNLAPMVDVMMCLIIFFLLASQLVNAERQPINLPFAEAAQEIEGGELGERITINIRPLASDPDGVEYVVADFDGESIVERRLRADEIVALFVTRVSAAGGPTDLRCVIRADREVHYQHVEEVLRACGQARIGNIVFSANAGSEAEPTQ